jgi:hypothetical protein
MAKENVDKNGLLQFQNYLEKVATILLDLSSQTLQTILPKDLVKIIVSFLKEEFETLVFYNDRHDKKELKWEPMIKNFDDNYLDNNSWSSSEFFEYTHYSLEEEALNKLFNRGNRVNERFIDTGKDPKIHLVSTLCRGC